MSCARHPRLLSILVRQRPIPVRQRQRHGRRRRARDEGIGRSVAMITGSHGTFCSGVALARDLVLTAGHCVLPGAEYKIVEFDAAINRCSGTYRPLRATPAST